MTRQALLVVSLVALVAAAPSAAPLTAQLPDVTILTGSVYDSILGQPLANAKVIVEGPTSFSVNTGQDGTFFITALPEGEYTVAVDHPRVGALGVAIPARSVTLKVGEEVRADLAMPSLATVNRVICGDSADASGLVLGYVRDDISGVAIPRARVTARWWDGSEHRRDLLTDGFGRYVLCGMPRDRVVSVSAEFLGVRGNPARVDPTPGLLRRDLGLRIGRSGRIVGRVVDYDTGRPVEAAEVKLDAGLRTVLTGQDGRFMLDDVPRGRHLLSIDHLAYGTVSDTVVVAFETLEIDAQLSQRAIEIEGLTVSVRSRALEINGFYQRREEGLGAYITRADIERAAHTSINDVLATVPGVRLIPRRGGTGEMDIVLRQRCRPIYVVDGQVMPPVGFRIQDLVPRDIEGIEIYRSELEIPPQYRRPRRDLSTFGVVPTVSTPCGAVLIWTR
ncbi:MAG: hypothetical protein D6701_01140 [Gemmatimonadetes bacterium]|nr:MAG: hypothetical protein D6701_01140 [Gemmatimonadota bacterium]